MLAGQAPMGRPKPGADLSTPSGFGGPPPAPPRQAAAPPTPPNNAGADLDNDNDVDQTSVPPPPEALSYHDDLHRCDMCQHMGQDGNCAVLQMQVQPEGACNAYSAKDEGGAMGDTDDDAGGDTDDGSYGY